ncbi:MAG: hypothetical protein HYX22_03040 [Candidatus Yanofskybacteria bacterium]|nr:hypothetical protein [Candidatus Yanofskybacteria bacterium]
MVKRNVCPVLILDNIRSKENVGSIFRTADAAGVSKIYLCGITPTPKIMKYGVRPDSVEDPRRLCRRENINQKIGSDLYHDRIINTISGVDNFDDKISKTALGADPVVENQAASLKENLIYTTGQGSDKISKTALGAENYVPWEYQSQTWRCLLKIKNQSSTPTPKGRGSDRSVGEVKIVGLERFDKLTASKLKIQQKNIFKYKVSKNKKIALVLGNEVRGLSPKILKYCDEVVYIPMYGKKESLNVSVAAGVVLYAMILKIKN